MFEADNENVADDDLVITMDINIFIMSSKIFQYLDQYPDYKVSCISFNLSAKFFQNCWNTTLHLGLQVWLPTYWEAAQDKEAGGQFAMAMIAMSGGMWKDVTGYNKFSGELEKLIEDYR